MAQPHFHPVPPVPPSLLLVIIAASSADLEQTVKESLLHRESQGNLNFILFYFGPGAVLCPRAPSSGSPFLGAELNSAARGKW